MSDKLKDSAEKERLEAATAPRPLSYRHTLRDHFQTTTPPPSQRRRVYSVKSFAFAIDVSERTVWRWIRAEKIQTIKISVGRVGIPVTELDRIVAEGVQ